MTNHDLYVSYAWKAEAESKIVDKLEAACTTRGIALKCDRNEVAYGESIRRYMDRIAAGAHVIVVLSDDYLKSEYCMYELRGIYANKGFRRRVSPIVLRGLQLDKPEHQIPYRVYWDKKFAELDAQIRGVTSAAYTQQWVERLNGYDECRKAIAELLDNLGDMNALTQDIHVDSDFGALFGRLEAAGIGRSARKQGQSDAEFRDYVLSQVQEILDRCRPLHDELSLVLADRPARQSVAQAICCADTATAIGDVLRPATERCLRRLKDTPEFDRVWDEAKAIMVWLGPLSVRAELVTQLENARSASDLSFEISVNTEFGVEVASARYRQLKPRLHAAEGKAEVTGAQAFHEPPYETGWGDDAALNALLLAIWRQVFPEESRASLSDTDLRTLNARLKTRERAKSHHYYVPVSLAQRTSLARPEYYKKLMAKLPALTVIYYNSTNAMPTLSVDDEYQFMSEVMEFLSIPHYLLARS